MKENGPLDSLQSDIGIRGAAGGVGNDRFLFYLNCFFDPPPCLQELSFSTVPSANP